jgi:hypothetical protein
LRSRLGVLDPPKNRSEAKGDPKISAPNELAHRPAPWQWLGLSDVSQDAENA